MQLEPPVHQPWQQPGKHEQQPRLGVKRQLERLPPLRGRGRPWRAWDKLRQRVQGCRRRILGRAQNKPVVTSTEKNRLAFTAKLGLDRGDDDAHTDAYLSGKEFERLGHEVRVELEHSTVSSIGIDDEVAMRKTPRQVVTVLTWNHAIAIAVGDKHRLLNL